MLTRARVLAVAALVTGAVGSYLWLNTGSSSSGGTTKTHAARPPERDSGLRAALRYVASTSPYVAVVQTAVRGPAVRGALGLADRFPGAAEAFSQIENIVHDQTGLDLTDKLPQLLGNPVVVAGAKGNVVLSWQTGSELGLEAALTAGVDSGDLGAAGTYHSASVYSAIHGSAVASIGPMLIAGTTVSVVRQAIDRSLAGAGALTPTGFDARAAGVPRSALVRVVASGSGLRLLLTRLYARAADVPWVSALSGGAIAVSAAADGLHAVAKLDTTPGVLTPDDLPLAAGSSAPVMHGVAGVSIGIRDLAHLGHFVLAAGEATNAPLIASYKQIDKLLTQFAHIDLDQNILSTLTGPATISTDDFSRFNLRATTTDASGVEDVLRRVAGIGRIGGFLGVNFGGFAVTSDDSGLVTITHDDSPVVTLGIRDGVLVASTDPNADFDAIAQGSERDGGTPPDRGALRATVSTKLLTGLLADRLSLPSIVQAFLEPLGRAIVTARASGPDITVRAFLPVK